MGCSASTSTGVTQQHPQHDVVVGKGRRHSSSVRGREEGRQVSLTGIHTHDDDGDVPMNHSQHNAFTTPSEPSSSVVTTYKMSHESCDTQNDEKMASPCAIFPGRRGSLLLGGREGGEDLLEHNRSRPSGIGIHRKILAAAPFPEEQHGHLHRRRRSSTTTTTTEKQQRRPVVFRSVLTDEEREHAERRRGHGNNPNSNHSTTADHHHHHATTTDTLNDLMDFNSQDGSVVGFGGVGGGEPITFEAATVTHDHHPTTNNKPVIADTGTPVVGTLRPVGGGFVPLGSSVVGTPINGYKKSQNNNNNSNVPILKDGAIVVVSPPLTMNSARSSLMSSFPDELGSPLSMTQYDQQHHHLQRQYNNNSSRFSSSRLSPQHQQQSPPPATITTANPNYVFTSTSSSSVGGGGGHHHHTSTTHASIACAPVSEVFSYAMISTVNNTSSDNNTTSSMSSQLEGGDDDDDEGGCHQIVPRPLQQYNHLHHHHAVPNSQKQYGSFDDEDVKSDCCRRGSETGMLQQFTVSFTNDGEDNPQDDDAKNTKRKHDDVAEFRPLIIVVDEQKQPRHGKNKHSSNNNSGEGKVVGDSTSEEEESSSPDLSIVTKADINMMGKSSFSSKIKEEEKSGAASTFHPPSRRSD